MARLLYRLLRAANVVGRISEDEMRKAMSSSSVLESVSRIAELDKPLSYALPMTGNAMAPLFNVHLIASGPHAIDAAKSQSRDGPQRPSSSKKDTLVIRSITPSPGTFLNKVHVDDVVVIRDPADERRKYVRRIAAMEGAQMVSDVPGDKPFEIPVDHCWVLRDNANASYSPDSRFFGPISLKNVIGRVMYAIRSASDHGRIANSPYAMATDAVVLAQESVTPFIDEHGRRNREGCQADGDADGGASSQQTTAERRNGKNRDDAGDGNRPPGMR